MKKKKIKDLNKVRKYDTHEHSKKKKRKIFEFTMKNKIV